MSFELRTSESKHQLRIHCDGTVLIVKDEQSYLYVLNNEKMQQVREYYGDFLLKYSEADNKQEYVEEILLNNEQEIISAHRIAVGETDYLGIQIYGSKDTQYITELKPVLMNYEKMKSDIGLRSFSISTKVDTQRNPKEIAECREQT